MKLLILTDSNGLPRKSPELLEYQDTFIGRLSKEFPNAQIVTCCFGGATIPHIHMQYDSYFSHFDADYTFIVNGIVDCAPRALSNIEKKIINSNPLTKLLSKKILTPKRISFLRKNRNVKYTNIKNFSYYANKIKQLNNNIYFFQIVPITQSYNSQVPGVLESRNKYNQVLKSVFKDKFIEYKDDESIIMSDNYHLNKKGHNLYFEIIRKIITC